MAPGSSNLILMKNSSYCWPRANRTIRLIAIHVSINAAIEKTQLTAKMKFV